MAEIEELAEQLKVQEPFHPGDVRPLPLRRRRRRDPRVARRPEARRREADGDDAHVRPARLLGDGRAARPGAGREGHQQLPRDDGRRHPRPRRDDRRVHRRLGPRLLRRARGARGRRRGAPLACALAMQKGMERVNRAEPRRGAPRRRDGDRRPHGRRRRREHRLREEGQVRRRGEPRQPDGADRELHLRRAGPHLRADAPGGGKGSHHGRLALREGEGLPRADPRARPPRHRGGSRAPPRAPGRGSPASRPSAEGRLHASSRGNASGATRSRPRSSRSR